MCIISLNKYKDFINILIADNQVISRRGIQSLLSDILDINVAGTPASFTALQQMITDLEPQVIIIDHHYNHHFTIQHLKSIASEYTHIRILVLSNRQSKSEILKVLGLGIKNFLFKECSREELVHAIYSAAKGEQFFCKNTFETLFGNKLIPGDLRKAPTLSSRETELIRLVAEGLTNREIAEKLFLSIHTVKTHRKNIIKKLGFTFKNTAEFASFIQLKKLI